MTDAVERYRELVELATSAGSRMREHERQSAERLGEAVAAGKQRQEESAARRDEVLEDVDARWKAALGALWDERWLRSDGKPAPDPSAPDATPEQSRRALDEAFVELYDALAKPRLLRRKKG